MWNMMAIGYTHGTTSFGYRYIYCIGLWWLYGDKVTGQRRIHGVHPRRCVHLRRTEGLSNLGCHITEVVLYTRACQEMVAPKDLGENRRTPRLDKPYLAGWATIANAKGEQWSIMQNTEYNLMQVCLLVRDLSSSKRGLILFRKDLEFQLQDLLVRFQGLEFVFQGLHQS